MNKKKTEIKVSQQAETQFIRAHKLKLGKYLSKE